MPRREMKGRNPYPARLGSLGFGPAGLLANFRSPSPVPRVSCIGRPAVFHLGLLSRYYARAYTSWTSPRFLRWACASTAHLQIGRRLHASR